NGSGPRATRSHQQPVGSGPEPGGSTMTLSTPPLSETTVRISASDAEFLAHLLNPTTDHIITLRTSDRPQPIDAHLDAVTIRDQHLVLECRHIGERSIPHGPTWTVPLADVVYLHIW